MQGIEFYGIVYDRILFVFSPKSAMSNVKYKSNNNRENVRCVCMLQCQVNIISRYRPMRKTFFAWVVNDIIVNVAYNRI